MPDSPARQARKRERRALRTGRWGPWEKLPGPLAQGYPARGWLAEVDRCYRNRAFAVLVRDVDTEWGPVLHLAIRNASGSEISWSSKQRIKDELVGRDRVAVEVFPSREQLVDGANMYHLWALPEETALPFTLKGEVAPDDADPAAPRAAVDRAESRREPGEAGR